MNSTRQQLLARSRLARDEHTHITRRYLARQRKYLLHPFGGSDELMESWATSLLGPQVI